MMFRRLASFWRRRRPAVRAGADSAEFGCDAEQLARALLKRAGLRIVAANYRCPFGEIDLIARDRGTLVFVEVKARRPRAAGRSAPPEAAVDRTKQRKIGQCAKHFMRRRKLTELMARFDVVAIEYHDGAEPAVRHHQGAFRPGL